MECPETQTTTDQAIVAPEKIERSILMIRGLKVILDADLAALYGVSTKALNQAIKRNKERFPSDFMFRLTVAEKDEVVTSCDHLRRLKFSPVLPTAFTEHGAIMAATVLNSLRAIRVSLFVVRAFLKLREMPSSQQEFAASWNRHRFHRSAGSVFPLPRSSNHEWSRTEYSRATSTRSSWI